MNLKILPLGSVCLVDGADLKLVVIGYKSNGYDYVAVDYPVGYENEGSLRYFNHEQIKDLYSYGYKDEFGQTHFVSLNDGTPSAANVELESSGFTFDDIGIVVEDTTAPLIYEEPIFSPEIEEDNVIYSPEVEEETVANNNAGFHFDENGVVIVDETAIEPEVVETTEVVEETVAPVESMYKFDENGFVVEDTTAAEIPSVNNFQFDENGVVIADATAPEVPNSMGSYKFDENGFVVEDATAPMSEEFVAEEVTTKEESQEEVINPEMSFQFDENGMVVLDTTTPVEESVENTTDTLFEDVEIPDEVEVQPEVSNEANLEVGTLSTEEDKSIFEEMNFTDEVKTVDEVVNFDIPVLENVEIPEEDASLATFDTKEEAEENKKEEKKKRGFFNFGK